MAIAKIHKEIISYDKEFDIDPTDTILSVEDNGDGTFTISIMTFVRKE